jgi:hypothetical protein
VDVARFFTILAVAFERALPSGTTMDHISA